MMERHESVSLTAADWEEVIILMGYATEFPELEEIVNRLEAAIRSQLPKRSE